MRRPLLLALLSFLLLPAGAAETGECVARHVMAARDRDLADRRGHIVDGDVEKTVGDFFSGLGAAELVSDCLKPSRRRFAV